MLRDRREYGLPNTQESDIYLTGEMLECLSQ